MIENKFTTKFIDNSGTVEFQGNPKPKHPKIQSKKSEKTTENRQEQQQQKDN